MKKHLLFLVAVIALSFALAIDTLAEAKRFWIGDPCPAILEDKTYKKYVWETFTSPDPTGQLWWPITTEFSPDELLLVRFNSFADEKIRPQMEWRIYTRISKPKEPPVTNTPEPRAPKCWNCHGGGAKLPPPKDSPAPPKSKPSGNDGNGTPADDGRGGKEDDGNGTPADDGRGGKEDDGNGGSSAKSDPSKKEKEGDKELKKLLSSLARGENPWKVGVKISRADPNIYGEKYFGDAIPFNPYYSTPLGGDSKRTVSWLYVEPYRELNSDGEQIGPTLARILLLTNKKK